MKLAQNIKYFHLSIFFHRQSCWISHDPLHSTENMFARLSGCHHWFYQNTRAGSAHHHPSVRPATQPAQISTNHTNRYMYGCMTCRRKAISRIHPILPARLSRLNFPKPAAIQMIMSFRKIQIVAAPIGMRNEMEVWEWVEEWICWYVSFITVPTTSH